LISVDTKKEINAVGLSFLKLKERGAVADKMQMHGLLSYERITTQAKDVK